MFDKVFYGCSSLSSITIPERVTTIKDYAFKNCTSLTSVIIPNSLRTIGTSIFGACSSLTAFYGDFTSEDNRCLIIEEPLKFRKSLIAFAPSGLTKYTIPDNVAAIGPGAFYDCSSLTSITIPEGVTKIGESAFQGCESLTSVHINNLMAWCRIDFDGGYGSNPLYFAHNLYLNNNLIMDMIIPEEVTTIVSYAFCGCNIQSVTIPNSVTTIENGAFSGCSNLQSLTIPESVTSLGSYTFSRCTSLQSVTIPNSVTTIKDGAFYYCPNLQSIIIPENITSIGSNAFQYCSKLTDIVCKPSTPPSLDDFTFDGIATSAKFYVPQESIDS